MSIATRKAITVPAAGVLEPIPVAGRVVYVEESPVNTPEGVPTFHLTNGGDGLPLYSRSALAWLPSFRRFWIKGTAAAAGSTLYLLVYDDPCAEGIYAEGRAIETPHHADCPEAPPPPEGDPTHMLVSSGAEILVKDDAGGTERTIISGRTQTGRFYVDYLTGRIYFGQKGPGASDIEVRRINFDGTGETLLHTFVTAFSGNIGVTFDESIGKLLIRTSENYFTLALDGGSPVTIAAGSATTSTDIAAANDGTHFFTCDGSRIHKRTLAAGTVVAWANLGNASGIIADKRNDRLFKNGSGATTDPIRYVDYAVTSQTDYVTRTTTAANKMGLYIFDRWLYYNKSNIAINRVHLDDATLDEQIIGGGGNIWLAPFWP